ncbi:hypothetical protein EB796_009016 [Bugula neritina]|uniref:CCHC-type domain-containing protein n=1 Tax=Bugula neritina TaxID=10212 RepID=A0A7J7K3B1_BUGNE|nr:hypothetical protein EB796_009016 [Bugula neritina]
MAEPSNRKARLVTSHKAMYRLDALNPQPWYLKEEKISRHTNKHDKQCTACGKSNHSTKDCYSKPKLFCNYCKKSGHIESVCRTKKKTNKTEISSANATYAFTVNASNQYNIATQNKSQGQLHMVDCGATSHLVNSENCFVSFDKSFKPENHYIEMADGHKTNQLAVAKGIAQFTITDDNNMEQRVHLKRFAGTNNTNKPIFSPRRHTKRGIS